MSTFPIASFEATSKPYFEFSTTFRDDTARQCRLLHCLTLLRGAQHNAEVKQTDCRARNVNWSRKADINCATRFGQSPPCGAENTDMAQGPITQFLTKTWPNTVHGRQLNDTKDKICQTSLTDQECLSHRVVNLTPEGSKKYNERLCNSFVQNFAESPSGSSSMLQNAPFLKFTLQGNHMKVEYLDLTPTSSSIGILTDPDRGYCDTVSKNILVTDPTTENIQTSLCAAVQDQWKPWSWKPSTKKNEVWCNRSWTKGGVNLAEKKCKSLNNKYAVNGTSYRSTFNNYNDQEAYTCKFSPETRSHCMVNPESSWKSTGTLKRRGWNESTSSYKTKQTLQNVPNALHWTNGDRDSGETPYEQQGPKTVNVTLGQLFGFLVVNGIVYTDKDNLTTIAPVSSGNTKYFSKTENIMAAKMFGGFYHVILKTSLTLSPEKYDSKGLLTTPPTSQNLTELKVQVRIHPVNLPSLYSNLEWNFQKNTMEIVGKKLICVQRYCDCGNDITAAPNQLECENDCPENSSLLKSPQYVGKPICCVM